MNPVRNPRAYMKISNGVKPRVLIFSIAYEPLVGGAELAVRNLTSRLSSFEFDLITCRFSRTDDPRERIGNVNVYRVGFGSRIGRYLYPVFAWRLAKKLHQNNPYQIVWSIMAAYAGAAALMFLRRNRGIKFLLTLQEGDSIAHIHKQVWGFKKRWQEIFKRADYIQAISQYLADWARSEGAVCPVEVVPNGVDPRSFSPLQRGRVRGGKKIIITVSRLVPKNGIDILIHAMAVIACLPDRQASGAKQSPKLMIIGAGPEETNLKKLAKDLKIDGIIEFAGHIKHDELPEYLSRADIFVRPSRSEGLGTAFLEAMSRGLPVIATRVGGISDFLTDGETGIFCRENDLHDLAEKIDRLISDDALRNKLSENGKRLVQKSYAWTTIAENMDKIFKSLLK